MFKKISLFGMARKNKLSLLYQMMKFDVLFLIISIFCYPLFFIFRKVFVAFTKMLTFFIFFFYRKISISFKCVLLLFVFFFKKILIRHKPLFEAFLCFLIISSWKFYICEKNIWLIFYILKTTQNCLRSAVISVCIA